MSAGSALTDCSDSASVFYGGMMVLNSYKGVNPFLVLQLLLFNRSRFQCCSLNALWTWPLWSATWCVPLHKSPNNAIHIICQASEPENIEMWAWIRSCLMQWLSKLWIFHMWKKSDVEFVVETNSEIILSTSTTFLSLNINLQECSNDVSKCSHCFVIFDKAQHDYY